MLIVKCIERAHTDNQENVFNRRHFRAHSLNLLKLILCKESLYSLERKSLGLKEQNFRINSIEILLAKQQVYKSSTHKKSSKSVENNAF